MRDQRLIDAEDGRMWVTVMNNASIVYIRNEYDYHYSWIHMFSIRQNTVTLSSPYIQKRKNSNHKKI